jgi:hypothetical protein
MSNLIKRTKRLFKTRSAKIAGSAALIIILLASLEITGVTHLAHKSSIPPVIPVSDNSGGSNDSQSSQTTTDTQQQSSTKSNSSSNSSSQSLNQSLPLYAPYGDFVSNHHPGDKSAPTSEVSVCNTTPGATCYIKFTNGATSTALPAKKTSSDGSAIWRWDIKDANLTSGDWVITAVATLNGETKTATDQLSLTIQ